MDTIYALASARGKAGVAVMRISGAQAFDAGRALMGTIPDPRKASLRRLSWAGRVLDEALVLRFDRGASFTGEDVLELQVHGSQAVVAALYSALGEQPGLRLAEPGEFTRRALENGQLDLAQVEGLADLIDAETEIQRAQAFRVLSGAVAERVDTWRGDILRCRALLEATIDFADEDVPVDVRPEVRRILERLILNLNAEVSGSIAAERVRDGFEVAIVGPPNVGKSTLLNALAGRRAALTSEIAGTTRDVIEVRMDLKGLAVTFLDTAGLRETTDQLEAQGIEIALARARAADLRVFLKVDAEDVLDLVPLPEDIILQGKGDLLPGVEGQISGLTGEGVTELIDTIAAVLLGRISGAGTLTRERHRRAVSSTLEALELVRIGIDTESLEVELAAEQLRYASRSLEVLIGRVDVEVLLGEIFSRFCIGK